MALLNYADLKTSIGRWLNRRDLAADIPDFITLAEDEMRRRVRAKTIRKTDFVISAESTTLPANCGQLRTVALIGVGRVKPVTQLVFDEMAASAVPGIPCHGCVVGRELLVTPAPAQAYTAEIKFFERLVPLSADNDTNSIFTDNKDVYLYGSLLQAAPFLKNDERVALWQTKFDAAIEQINKQREDEEFPTGMAAKLPVVFGGPVQRRGRGPIATDQPGEVYE